MEENMEQQDPSVRVQETPTSIRVRLVQTVIEHYVDLVLFEALDIDVLEPQFQNMLSDLLGFETKAELVRDPNIIDMNMLMGKITFLDGDGQQAGLKTVSFQVSASGTEVEPFDDQTQPGG